MGLETLFRSTAFATIQGVPGGMINILGGYSVCHSKQKKTLYEHVSYSERFPT